MLFKVGQRVMVRPDLKYQRRYKNISNDEGDIVTGQMYELKGKQVTISSISTMGKYRIEEESSWWTEEMFVIDANEDELFSLYIQGEISGDYMEHALKNKG
jgi:hypothetical protein